MSQLHPVVIVRGMVRNFYAGVGLSLPETYKYIKVFIPVTVQIVDGLPVLKLSHAGGVGYYTSNSQGQDDIVYANNEAGLKFLEGFYDLMGITNNTVVLNQPVKSSTSHFDLNYIINGSSGNTTFEGEVILKDLAGGWGYSMQPTQGGNNSDAQSYERPHGRVGGNGGRYDAGYVGGGGAADGGWGGYGGGGGGGGVRRGVRETGSEVSSVEARGPTDKLLAAYSVASIKAFHPITLAGNGGQPPTMASVQDLIASLAVSAAAVKATTLANAFSQGGSLLSGPVDGLLEWSKINHPTSTSGSDVQAPTV